MKAIIYTMGLATIVLSSCATGFYAGGGEYDDLYYTSADKPAVSTEKSVPQQIAEGNLKPEQYYDNMYSNDTLVADGYNDAVDFDNSMYYNKDNSAFEYGDDYSYSNRLRRFYGNYFDPYWRDSFGFGFGSPYFSFGYPSFGYGYGGYGFGYDPFMSGYGMYDPFYGGYYGGGFYGGYYGSFYNPYYLGYGNYTGSFYGNDNRVNVGIARRERASSLSNTYNPSNSPRKSNYQSNSVINGDSRRSGTTTQNPGSEVRRTSDPNTSSRQSSTTLPQSRYTQSQQGQARRAEPNSVNNANQRVEYRSANRSYTPSYNNPRMSTRPSYNNSRIQSGSSSVPVQNNSRMSTEDYVRRSNSVNYNSVRSYSAPSQSQYRSVTTNPGRSESYSVPSRSSAGSSYTPSRSFESSSSGSTRSTYSGGSSSGGGGGSVSSGSGSSGSSGGSGRRR